ncbi:helix-turn-helix domain-containing protein [Nocardioides sp. Leaf374]|uniref:helix-turn-helix domain-containing protein n=1 Tax=Nocardioides sp. Leaf374 TaxID=2876560 RepID=UPI001E57085B|nr:hypothetical protein [Nocardioides sp. Leaf374]
MDALTRLVARIADVDQEAADALRALEGLDSPWTGVAGVDECLRTVASLAGSVVELHAPAHGLWLRASATRVDPIPVGAERHTPGPEHPLAPLEGGVGFLLRRGDHDDLLASVVTARAARLLGPLLDERRRASAPTDAGEGALEVAVDPEATPEDRLDALRRLRLRPEQTLVLHAVPGPRPSLAPPPAWSQVGVSRPRPASELPIAWNEARMALRLTATGEADDPGERWVRAGDVGSGLLALAAGFVAGAMRSRDVVALDAVGAPDSPAGRALTAISETTTIRSAAERIPVHHSTLQRQVKGLERELGWSVTEPAGRLRLDLAFALRRLERNYGRPGLY